jgi:hypothetical protein
MCHGVCHLTCRARASVTQLCIYASEAAQAGPPAVLQRGSRRGTQLDSPGMSCPAACHSFIHSSIHVTPVAEAHVSSATHMLSALAMLHVSEQHHPPAHWTLSVLCCHAVPCCAASCSQGDADVQQPQHSHAVCAPGHRCTVLQLGGHRCLCPGKYPPISRVGAVFVVGLCLWWRLLNKHICPTTLPTHRLSPDISSRTCATSLPSLTLHTPHLHTRSFILTQNFLALTPLALLLGDTQWGGSCLTCTNIPTTLPTHRRASQMRHTAHMSQNFAHRTLACAHRTSWRSSPWPCCWETSLRTWPHITIMLHNSISHTSNTPPACLYTELPGPDPSGPAAG